MHTTLPPGLHTKRINTELECVLMLECALTIRSLNHELECVVLLECVLILEFSHSNVFSLTLE
jgi:hypothetical protein